MTVDIELVCSPGAHPDPFDYMKGRPHLFDVEGRTAAYHQPNTGVTATLVGTDRGVSVHIPVLRPSYWGREIGDVVERLANACSLTMGGDVAAAPAVEAVWSSANTAAWQLDTGMDRAVLPDSLVERWWRWNRRLIDLEPLYDGAYVGPVRICVIDSAPCLCAVWTDLVDALLPPVDVVLVLSAQLSSAGLPVGLIPIERDDVETLARSLAPDGALVLGARRDQRWLELLHERDPLRDKLIEIHPEAGIESRFSSPDD